MVMRPNIARPGAYLYKTHFGKYVSMEHGIKPRADDSKIKSSENCLTELIISIKGEVGAVNWF